MQFLLLLTISTIYSVKSLIPPTNPYDFGTDHARIMYPNVEDVDDDDAKHFVNYAFANYCPNVEAWNCRFCLKTSKLIQSFSDPDWQTQGILVVDDSKREVIVSLMGSYHTPNMLRDVFAKPEPLVSSHPEVVAHPGFLGATKSLFEDVSTSLTDVVLGNDTLKEYDVIFTGHSLGGAMASLMVSLLRISKHEIVEQSSLYTYGQPRTGNRGYADFVNSYAENHAVGRVTGGRDVVPHLYPFTEFLYLHHGTEIHVENNKVVKICRHAEYEDPGCSNRIGPDYNTDDHFNAYWLRLEECVAEAPAEFLGQFFFPVVERAGLNMPKGL